VFLLIAAHAFFVSGTITVDIVATMGAIVAMLLLELAYIIINIRWLDTMQKEVAKSVPIIILAMVWRGLSTRSAVVGRLIKNLVVAELASDITT
jgi:hypothetical protein